MPREQQRFPATAPIPAANWNRPLRISHISTPLSGIRIPRVLGEDPAMAARIFDDELAFAIDRFVEFFHLTYPERQYAPPGSAYRSRVVTDEVSAPARS
jgi:hypothetical protein